MMSQVASPREPVGCTTQPHADSGRFAGRSNKCTLRAKNGLDYFITRDEKTILNYAAEIRSAVGIPALLPTEFLQRLGAPSRSG